MRSAILTTGLALAVGVCLAGERLELAHGVVVETVELASPRATLVVARVPRGKGLRLRAALLDDERAALLRPGPVAQEAGALVAINGDFHYLLGFPVGTPYSTFVDRGRARVVTWSHSYASALLVGHDGVARIGSADLSAELVLPDQVALPLRVNGNTGDALLITRPPPRVWSAPEHEGWELLGPGGPLEAGPRWRLGAHRGPGATRKGPALLARGEPAAALLKLGPGAEVAVRLGGADAGKLLCAIGTGPRLLERGQLAGVLATPADRGWSTRRARTAVGLAPDGLVLAVTPRGAGLSLEDLARALRALGCTEATNLDGGPSSCLWADGRVLSGDEDAVASGLLVLPPTEGEVGFR